MRHTNEGTSRATHQDQGPKLRATLQSPWIAGGSLHVPLLALLTLALLGAFGVRNVNAQPGICCAPIRGTVKSTSGQPVANVNVTVSAGGAVCGRATTDSSGTFTVQIGAGTTPLPVACYAGATVSLSVSGATVTGTTATLRSGDTQSQPVTVNLTALSTLPAGQAGLVLAATAPPPPPAIAPSSLPGTPTLATPAPVTAVRTPAATVGPQVVAVPRAQAPAQGSVAVQAPAKGPVAVQAPAGVQRAMVAATVTLAPVAAVPAAPSLPNTGNGGLLNRQASALSPAWALMLALLGTLLASATAVSLRRGD